MKTAFQVKWTAANALGLGVAFVAYLQVPMLVEFGLDFERHWQWQEQAVETSPVFYVASLVALLVAGVIFGASQAVALRSYRVPVIPWILATAVGFVLLMAVFGPLAAAGVLGVIPGPVEPILFTVVGGSLAGVCQYQALRWQRIAASRWLVRWIVGLVVGLVPTTAFFISVEGAGIALGWLPEVFFTGFWVAGVAALVSGSTLFSALSSARLGPEVSRTSAAETTR
jgi:hypothetical protein